MFPVTDYLKFLFSATNEHGVHSPFVYGYLTRCLYRKPRLHRDKALDVLLKSIPYFKVKTMGLPQSSPGIKELVGAAYPEIRFQQPPYDLLYLEAPDPAIIREAMEEPAQLHNDSLCIIQGIHADKMAGVLWREVRALEQVRVSIDGFFCGLVFFRRQQAEQHFKIRI